MRPLLIAVCVAALAGCVVTPRGSIGVGVEVRAPAPIYVETAPPAPIYEVVPAVPAVGYMWIHGYWTWRDNRHFWVPGRWERPPQPGGRWYPPRWERHDRGYHHYPGYWGR